MKKKRALAASRESDEADSTYVFRAGNLLDNNEMLKISQEGFWVRGVQVAPDVNEAKIVFDAFKEWLAWSALSRKN